MSASSSASSSIRVDRAHHSRQHRVEEDVPVNWGTHGLSRKSDLGQQRPSTTVAHEHELLVANLVAQLDCGATYVLAGIGGRIIIEDFWDDNVVTMLAQYIGKLSPR